MTSDAADEWRRRILARQRFLEFADAQRPTRRFHSTIEVTRPPGSRYKYKIGEYRRPLGIRETSDASRNRLRKKIDHYHAVFDCRVSPPVGIRERDHNMSDAPILLDAEFDPRVKPYWTWMPVLGFTLGIVTIPIAILYAVVAGFFIDRYLANLRCALTGRTLDIKKGIWNKTESTIPLEKITDLQLFQGPVMRYFGLHGFKVETAERDRMDGGVSTVPVAQTAALGSGDRQTTELLTEIRDSLQRIEQSITSRPDR